MTGRQGELGVVIAGAGARGAYEIGALSVLVPWLRRRDIQPRVIVGTSAGAINAVLVAAMCGDRDPDAAAEAALHSWRAIGRADVFRSIALSSPSVAARYVATVLGLARPPLAELLSVASLLDPTPLRGTLEDLGPWGQLRVAVSSGAVRSVAVVTTSYTAGSTVVLVESADPDALPEDDVEQGVQYRPARLGPDEVLASAAIPLAFPAVRLDGAAADGWYLDGGVRLNAPIKPSLALGAERLLVVATHPLPDLATPPPDAERPPDVVDAASALITSVMVDRMAQDVRNLDRINRLVEAGATGTGYRTVPYLFVAPDTPDAIGRIARQVLTEKYGNAVPAPADFDYTVLARLLGGPGESHAEIMSFLLFDPDFINALIDLGRRDAAAAVHPPDGVDLPEGWPFQRVRNRTR